MHPSRLVSAIALALLSFPALAEDTTPAEKKDAPTIGTVTVVATRSEHEAVDVPATVSVIDRERLDREQSRTLKDLFRYEAGVSVSQAYGRFGIGDVRIRGLGGNRVQLQVDGADISDSFSIGSFSSAGRDFIDPDLIERVELLRGSASALYGSDALGGVVSFRTLDPDAITRLTGRDWALRLGAHSVQDDGSLGASALLAQTGAVWQGMLQFHQNKGNEVENQGDNFANDRSRTANNPQDITRSGVLAKLVRDSGNGHRLRLTVDGSRTASDTDVLSSRGAQVVFGQTVMTNSLLADDEQQRERVSLGMEGQDLSWGWANAYQVQLYRQNSRTEQYTREHRATVVGGVQVNPALRERIFTFDQSVTGLELQLRKEFTGGGSEHALTYGLSYKDTDIEQKRDGQSTNLTTGVVTKAISPDTFPVRDFPISKTRELGLFVQDEMRFFDGRLHISPALRWDRYRLTPTVDNIFAGDNPGISPVSLSKSHLSPKLAAAWKISENWSIYASAAEGFRAPPYNDANLGFTNLQQGYTAIPNPNLRPETSRGYEIGTKASGDWGSIAFAVYDNRYSDFIESLRFIGIDPNSGLMVFQSQNIAKVRIRGAELSAHIDLGHWGADGWNARAALSTARGDDETAKVPLNSIDPPKAVLGIGYQGERFGAELIGSFAKHKTRVAPLDSLGTKAFAPAGYGVFDLLTSVKLADTTRFELALLNLGDKKYWDWSDVPGVAATSPLVDRYSRPGRGIRLALNHTF
ncbi:TonB-dependent hemoglobin/transferrin/lactoferrin family receptor [Arenimonas sp.]|uniref:TonB-dependent hemoglobin/transferrin/lactoferrin family receptor n=1 Tax=Arenimonas sp. TaxID=1872635 RepID=UPI0039E69091